MIENKFTFSITDAGRLWIGVPQQELYLNGREMAREELGYMQKPWSTQKNNSVGSAVSGGPFGESTPPDTGDTDALSPALSSVLLLPFPHTQRPTEPRNWINNARERPIHIHRLPSCLERSDTRVRILCQSAPMIYEQVNCSSQFSIHI